MNAKRYNVAFPGVVECFRLHAAKSASARQRALFVVVESGALQPGDRVHPEAERLPGAIRASIPSLAVRRINAVTRCWAEISGWTMSTDGETCGDVPGKRLLPAPHAQGER